MRLQLALSAQRNIFFLLEKMEARRFVRFTRGSNQVALGGGGGCTTRR
jgi:hypothetical protein